MPLVYLAGPDVFLPDALAVGRLKQARCREHGIEGLFPLDSAEDVAADPARIFEANCALMDRADAGLLNLSPFRGPSADVGTCFELGYLHRAGKPLFGYANSVACYRQRVEGQVGTLAVGRFGPTDPDGYAVEDFALHDNLMLVRALEASGGGLWQRTGAQSADPLAALEAFDAGLAALVAYFGSRSEPVRRP